MERGADSFKQACCWCKEFFLARNQSDICCSIGCFEQVHEAAEELRHTRQEFESLCDKVNDLHEELFWVLIRIERQVKKLRRLGSKWPEARTDDARIDIEAAEKKVSRRLARLNIKCKKQDRLARPAEKQLFNLEQELQRLKNIANENRFSRW